MPCSDSTQAVNIPHHIFGKLHGTNNAHAAIMSEQTQCSIIKLLTDKLRICLLTFKIQIQVDLLLCCTCMNKLISMVRTDVVPVVSMLRPVVDGQKKNLCHVQFLRTL